VFQDGSVPAVINESTLRGKTMKLNIPPKSN
jgi:hypothetical protein